MSELSAAGSGLEQNKLLCTVPLGTLLRTEVSDRLFWSGYSYIVDISTLGSFFFSWRYSLPSTLPSLTLSSTLVLSGALGKETPTPPCIHPSDFRWATFSFPARYRPRSAHSCGPHGGPEMRPRGRGNGKPTSGKRVNARQGWACLINGCEWGV